MRDTNTNVFKFGYYPCGRVKNIFHNIKNFFRTLKWAWQRAVNGYCDFDLYDLDIYHTNMMIKALRELFSAVVAAQCFDEAIGSGLHVDEVGAE